MIQRLNNQGSDYDLNQDGSVSEEELSKSNSLVELELREQKASAQKHMSWVALFSMLLFTAILCSPIVSDSRVAALADLLGLFYIAQASIIGFYFGATAYMSK